MNKTKVIATVSKVTATYEVLENLINNGVSVIRINMRYSDLEFCCEVVQKIGEINTKLNKHTAIMVDLKGPVIQIERVANEKAWLKAKDKIRIFTDNVLGDSTKFSVDYKNIVKDASIGMIIKIGTGEVILKILEKGINYLICEVIKPGYISSGKIVNVVGLKQNRPFISIKDLETIKMANKLDIDYLVVSFVNSSEDVLEVNDLLINLGNDHLQIISKIENQSAYDDIDNIIKISDGIIIARDNLGTNVPIEKIPGIQKKIIDKCHKAGVVSVVTTDLLLNKEEEQTPTRAEVSDIANAILDGCDAVLLSGGVNALNGQLETIKTMNKVIMAAEGDANYNALMETAIKSQKKDITGAIAYNVSGCANLLNCKAIFAPTITGYTAKKISRFRPVCPIIALSPNADTVKSLALNFGIHSFLVDELNSLDAIIEKCKIMSRDVIGLQPNDIIIITGGSPFREVKHTNFMKIEEL